MEISSSRDIVNDVAIFYVTGSYLNSDMTDKKDSRIKLEGEFVDIMCNVNPEI